MTLVWNALYNITLWNILCKAGKVTGHTQVCCLWLPASWSVAFTRIPYRQYLSLTWAGCCCFWRAVSMWGGLISVCLILGGWRTPKSPISCLLGRSQTLSCNNAIAWDVGTAKTSSRTLGCCQSCSALFSPGQFGVWCKVWRCCCSAHALEEVWIKRGWMPELLLCSPTSPGEG